MRNSRFSSGRWFVWALLLVLLPTAALADRPDKKSLPARARVARPRIDPTGVLVKFRDAVTGPELAAFNR